MHKNTIKYCIKLDLCKDSGLDESVLAWLRLGVREVSIGDWLFNFDSNFKLLGQLFWLFSSFSFSFNSYVFLINVPYM